ncbi:MAG: SDR family NAD(P)-dependent oxidoreductase [Promethearchaeota archaeon]|nr:MAG: SDR family NAD(P)-dependent oxidoreductase [Candidatus Lokiarchaeota archaeon]
MGMLDGKVALITGAGRGLGREEALAMARAGCNLVINDLGASFDGTGAESKVADEVAKECMAFGVKAVGNYDSVADFNKAKGMIEQAVSEFGQLDIVVNNAGILRDRMIFNMSEAEFDAVIAVHLKGTFNVTRHAAEYFRKRGKEDPKLKNFGRVINTASDAGLLGNVGQANYGAAKAGIAAFTLIVSEELKKYATVNCVVPMARTRLTVDATPQTAGIMQKKDNSGFDVFDPAHFAPLIVYLASDKARRVTGEVFRAAGDKVWVYRGWHSVNRIDNNGKPFTPEELSERVKSELLKGLPAKEGIQGIASEVLGLM